MTRTELEALCRDICPCCAEGKPLRQREDTLEHVHDFADGPGFAHTLCLATHLRNKYKDQLDG